MMHHSSLFLSATFDPAFCMELHDYATLPYAAHMNLVACASTDLISACTSPIQKSGKHPFLATLTTVALPMPCNDATASAPESP